MSPIQSQSATKLSRASLIGLLSLVLLATLLMSVWPQKAEAQANQISLSASRMPIKATMSAYYQQYNDGEKIINETSFPVSLMVPLSTKLSLGIWTSHASIGGDKIASLSGVADTQLLVSYVASVGNGSLVVSLGANLPSGKIELTTPEFDTAILLSQTAFNFRVPSYGHGFGLSPTLTWAIPVSSNLVLGLGAAYQHRSGYKPLEDFEDDYTPGNEILITAGFDSRISSNTALSLDVTHSLYEADKIGEVEIFDSGNKTVVTAMIRRVTGFNELRLIMAYRTRAKSSELAGTELVTQEQRTVPNELVGRLSYSMRLNSTYTTTWVLGARSYDETAFYGSRQLVDIGVEPYVRLSDKMSLATRFIYTLGSIDGFEGGLGLVVDF
jgi:hypothetical protein